MSKGLREILAEATDEQAAAWFEEVKEDRWPKDMPIPMESLHCVWHQLQKRVIAIKPKEKEKKDA
jgi:hypothetical protein